MTDLASAATREQCSHHRDRHGRRDLQGAAATAAVSGRETSGAVAIPLTAPAAERSTTKVGQRAAIRRACRPSTRRGAAAVVSAAARGVVDRPIGAGPQLLQPSPPPGPEVRPLADTSMAPVDEMLTVPAATTIKAASPVTVTVELTVQFPIERTALPWLN